MEPKATSTLDMIRASATDLNSNDRAKRERAEEIKKRYEAGLFNDKLVAEGAKPVPVKSKPEEVQNLVQSAQKTQSQGKVEEWRANRPEESLFTRTIKDVPSDVVETLDRMTDAFTGGLERAKANVTNDKLSLGQKFLGGVVQPFVGAADAFGEGVLGVGKLAFSPEAEEKIGEILIDTVTAGVESEPGQWLVPRVQNWYNKLDEDDKFLVNQLGGIGMVVTEVLLTKGALSSAKAASEPVKQGVKQGMKTLATGAEMAQEGLAQGARQIDNIFRDTDEQLANYVDEYFMESVRPSIAGQNTTGAVNRAREQRLLAVETIAENAENLRFLDENGNEIVGQAPQSLQQLGESIEQTKEQLYKQYNALARQAGETGITVNTADFANELDVLINDRVLQMNAPDTVEYAKQKKRELLGNLEEGVIYADEMPPSISPEEVERAIAIYNQDLKTFYQNPTIQQGRKLAVDALIVNNYRKALDNAIEGATGEQYQALKNQYGAVRSIEQDVMKAMLRDQKRNTAGLIDYSDIFSGGQMVSGILSLNPAQFAQGTAQVGIKQWMKFLNDPNQNVRRMFETQAERMNRTGDDMGPLESAFRNPTIGLATQAVDDAGNPLIRKADGTFETAEETAAKARTNSFLAAGIDISENDNIFQVGITNVAGEGRFRSDEILERANQAFDAGNLEEAEKLYEEAVQFGIKTINDRFQNSGIKVKTKPAYGVFEGRPEPSIDMVATVPPSKVDEFHAILADLAGNNFNQDSVITYRNVVADNPTFGVVDEGKGLAYEPVARISLNRELELSEIKELSDMMQKNGIYAYSLLDDGKQIDILNLSYYNNNQGQVNYDGFIQNIERVIGELESRDLYQGTRTAVVEARHIGNSAGVGRTTYKQVRDNFQQTNPERAIATDQRYRSSFLDSLPQKSFYSKPELEQALNRVQSPREKEVMQTVVDSLPDGKISYKDIDEAVKKHILRTNPEYIDNYAKYGLDEAGIDYDSNSPKVIRFATGVDTGVQSHMGTSDELGWARVFTEGGENYVVELQSDAFQRGLKMVTPEQIAERIAGQKDSLNKFQTSIDYLRSRIQFYSDAKPSDYVKKVDGGYQRIEDINKGIFDERRTFKTRAEALESAKEYLDTRVSRVNSELRTTGDRILDAEKNLQKLEAERVRVSSPEYIAKAKQFESLASSNKYRKRLLEETLFELAKNSPDRTINIPTPSTVARVEWNYGNQENAVPYRQANGDPFRAGDDDLVPGDLVEYLGEEYVVVNDPVQGRGWGGPPPRGIQIAPADKVATSNYWDAIENEVRYRVDEVEYELKTYGDELTLAELQDLAINADDWSLQQAAKDKFRDVVEESDEVEFQTYPGRPESYRNPITMEIVSGGDKKVLSKSDLLDEVRSRYDDDDWEQYWQDIYGADNVFIEYGGGGAGSSVGPVRVTFVEDGVTPEYFEQPSAYDPDVDWEELFGADFDKAQAEKLFSETQMGVLNNYFEYQNLLKEMEQKQDFAIDWDSTLNSYQEEPLTFIKVTVPKSFKISN